MNKDWVNIINEYLSTGIERGYESGIKSIVAAAGADAERARNNTEAGKKQTYKFEEDPMYSISYTAADEEAIRNFKIEAFTVAGVGSWELEEKLKEIAEKYMRKEIDKDEFELETRKKMMQYGIGLGEQAPTGWLEANLNNAVVSSISAARWIRMNDPEVTKVYPALKYRTQRDGRVRNEHRLLDGLILRKDDPAWKTIYPPNGWNCRCYTEPMTEEEVADAGAVKGSTAEQRKEWNKEVDEDFRRNPGMSGSIWGKWLRSELSGLPKEELSKLKSLIREYGKTL